MPPPLYPVSPSPGTEIHSASTEMLTSDSLEELRKLLNDAYNERHELTTELSVAEWDAKSVTGRFHKWDRGFLLKHLFKTSFATRK